MTVRSTCFILVIFAAIWASMAFWKTSPPASRPSNSQDSSAKLRELVAKHEDLKAAALETTTTRSLTHSSAKDPTQEWPATEGRGGAGRPRRASTDLVRLFLDSPQHVSVARLVQHPQLNAVDYPIPEGEVQSLGELVDLYKSALTPLMENYHRIEHQEMIDLADALRVRPAELPRPSDEEIIEYAHSVARSPEEEAILVARYLRDPPVGPMSGRSFLTHGGKTYFLTDFTDLPVSHQALLETRGLSTEFLAAVCEWFAARGLASTQELAIVLSRAWEEAPGGRQRVR
ncbi:MAG: hypothetical protein H6833_10135 [Planctomycetes bacterium]|nr:hypothetical protein [Planctomycetota bacterium]